MQTRTYDYSYLPCQFCVGKNHCRQCGDEIAGALLGLPGVTAAQADGPAKKLTLTVDGADFEDIEARAEALGVLL